MMEDEKMLESLSTGLPASRHFGVHERELSLMTAMDCACERSCFDQKRTKC